MVMTDYQLYRRAGTTVTMLLQLHPLCFHLMVTAISMLCGLYDHHMIMVVAVRKILTSIVTFNDECCIMFYNLLIARMMYGVFLFKMYTI